MAERTRFNQKRRVVVPVPAQQILNNLAGRVQYRGSPYHKRNPGDFALTPPSQPRRDKTLCDGADIVTVAEAQKWLKEGVRRGMISRTREDGFPKYIWAVTGKDVVLEAQYSNEGPGCYHGYPLFEPDPFREVILDLWRKR